MPDDTPHDDAATDAETASGSDGDANGDTDGEGNDDTDGVPDADDAPEHEDGDEVSRRWLIRALVGLGIGIPILVEARTLYHILTDFLFGGGDGGDAATRTTSPPPSTGIGDELLPATEPSDTLSDAELRVGDDGWVFHATATVENTGGAPYTLALGAVTTESGTRVDGGADTGRVPVGETEDVSAEWTLPTGETPDTLAITGIVHADDGDERVERTVRLGSVPTRG